MKTRKIILPLLFASFLFSCGNTDNNIYYTVSFDTRGGTEIAPQRVIENNLATRPFNPHYADHTFLGWYKDTSFEETAIFNFEEEIITSDVTIYASWQEVTLTEEVTPSLTFKQIESGYEVTGVGEEERVIIPSTYNNLPVTRIGDAAFARKDITYVYLPDTVTEIGLNAFNNASSLQEIRIGENSLLERIENNAFSGNSSLESIYIPYAVEFIGDSVFNNASSLNSITVASDNTHYYSTGNNLIETDTQTLLRGSNSSVIPSGVREIASAAFRRSQIESITIPSSVETIASNAFDDASSLKGINVETGNSHYSSVDGVLYNNDQSTLLFAPEGHNSSINIPNTISAIPSFAFDGRSSITSIYIPTSVTSFAAFSFRGVTATLSYQGTETQWNDITKHSTWGGASLEVSYGSVPSEDIDIYTIYFSATGNTEGIANLISNYTSSSLYEIEALVPYTSEDLDYSNSSCRANQEQNNASSRPEIGSQTIDLSDYEVIYLGYPIWWGKAPKIIYTFLDTYDLSNKTIIPFATSGSSGITGSESDLHTLEPNATWLSGRRFSSSASQETINTWIDSLEY